MRVPFRMLSWWVLRKQACQSSPSFLCKLTRDHHLEALSPSKMVGIKATAVRGMATRQVTLTLTKKQKSEQACITRVVIVMALHHANWRPQRFFCGSDAQVRSFANKQQVPLAYETCRFHKAFIL